MAREGRGKLGLGVSGLGSANCSYKRTTLVICSINIVIALFVLRSLYSSLYVFTSKDHVVQYTSDQIKRMQESIRIRKAHEPVQLIKLVNQLKREFWREEPLIQLPKAVKERIVDDVLQRLKSLPSNASINDQRESVESWRKEKLEEVKRLSVGSQELNSTLLQEEAAMLVRALESEWSILSEEIGLYIPTEVVHKTHDDKPVHLDDMEDDHILAGRRLPQECNAELHTDYDGAAVRWGLTHHKESAADCCQACLDQAKNAKPGDKKCNIWVYCPVETGCHSPDIYQHKHMECWLKFSETPKLNFKETYSESYRRSHPTAPLIVPWVSGVLSV